MNNYERGDFYHRCSKCSNYVGYMGRVIDGTPFCFRHTPAAEREDKCWHLAECLVWIAGAALIVWVGFF